MTPDQRVRLAPRVIPVTKGHRGIKVTLDLRVRLGLRVFRVTRGLKALQAVGLQSLS